MIEFTKCIAKTSDMKLFQAPFVQRCINYQWDVSFKFWLYLVLFEHILTCLLICTSLMLLKFEQGTT